MIDLTDRNFGRLTVIDLAELDRHGHYIWSCLCDCGRQVRAATHDLLRGHTRSCGCWRTERLASAARARAVPVTPGARFGMLTIIAAAGRNERRRALVRAVCDCGAEHVAEWNNVRQGVTKSCGCQKREKGWRESLRVRMARRAVPSNAQDQARPEAPKAL